MLMASHRRSASKPTTFSVCRCALQHHCGIRATRAIVVNRRRTEMAGENPSVTLVRRYIEAVQKARASGDVADFEALRDYPAADVVTKVASPWTDEPWLVLQRGADAVIARMQAPINKATSLTTEKVSVQQAGNDVLVEQPPASSPATVPTSAWSATSFPWSTAPSPACGPTGTSAGALPFRAQPSGTAARSGTDPAVSSRFQAARESRTFRGGKE